MIDILQIHKFTLAFMTGLIWLIQLVHYPAFLRIDEERFVEFHRFHSRWITMIVAPVMGVELLTAGLLVYFDYNWIFLANLVGVLLIWISTAFLSVPYHNQLAQGKQDAIIHRLIVTNWPRTVIWTVRAVALAFLAK